MKERPILFSGPMVRAILEGRKTQTRRVVKEPYGLKALWFKALGRPAVSQCPYGQPGDRLWVRETWQPGTWGPSYRADFTEESARRCLNPWKSCIHMPRRFSRITLEVTEVRVQRLQDISEEDAQAEGCHLTASMTHGERGPGAKSWVEMPKDGFKGLFRELWDSINGQRQGCAWADNPWVWAVSFRRV